MYIGIDIGGTKCAVIKAKESMDIVCKKVFATTGPEETLQRIINIVNEMMPAKAIGISCGGPLDEEGGIILSPPNLPGWDNIKIKEILEDKFSVPVKLRNDANACALAEYKFGAGKGYKNIVFLTFGTGLGAGLILNGKLYSGSNGNAGEVGHIRLADDGPIGYGKRGSFEGFCSGGGIARLALEYIQSEESKGRKSELKNHLVNGEIDTKTLAELAYGGNKDAIKIFDISADYLGRGLSVIIDILNPDAIVIGSVYSRAKSLFDKKMYEVICREALGASSEKCSILPALLGEQIGDVAAITVAMEERDEV